MPTVASSSRSTAALSNAVQVSPLATGDGSLRRGARRTLPVYGVCVHTTSGGPARRAKGARTTPLRMAMDFYVHGSEGFPHYVIDYEGTIHSICDEGHVAWHAGWARGRRWDTWTAPSWWSRVWTRWHARTPADLLPPGAHSPNDVYVGVELLADQTGWGFTRPQYEALARLVVDVFRRHGIPLSEPPNPRLLGHEDVEPVERATAAGGWDPGAHRLEPKFSWSSLWALIRNTGAAPAPSPASAGGTPPSQPPAVGSTFGAAEAAAAFARGERDVDRLTDIVFQARHPELGGRRIGPAQTQLANEWLWIRDHVVAPAVARATDAATPTAAPAAGSAAQFARSVPAARRWAALIPLVEKYRGDIPLWFVLGWIAVESDARIDVVTKLNERGFFQIHPDESKDAKPPIRHDLLSVDPDYSVRAGIQLVRSYAELARQRFPWIPYGSELFWRVVKYQHAMGSPTANLLLSRMRASGIDTTWEAIRRYEITEGPKLARILTFAPRGRFASNVDRVVRLGMNLARPSRR